MKTGSKCNRAIKILAGFWIGLTVVALLVSLLSVLDSIQPVSLAKIRRLRYGMETKEVRAVLGKPSSAVTDTYGSQLWDYNGFSLRVFELHFDASGHLVSFETD